MTQLLSRVTVLVNKSNRVIELKEIRKFAPDGFYSYTIQLHPSDRKEIGATMFHRRAKEAGRPTVIRVFVDRVDYYDDVLTPQVFIEFFRISFRVDEGGKMMVRGVRATPTDQFCRIRLVGSLIGGLRCLIRGDEHESQEEDILFKEKETGTDAALQ